MANLEQLLPSFTSELEKLALPAWLGNAANYAKGQVGAVGAGMGLGAVAGAGLNAAHSGYQNYQQAREQGASGGTALLHGLAGGLGAVPMGAAVGAGLGAGAGLIGGPTSLGLSARLAKSKGAVGSVARFGQRQVHGVTGLVPAGAGSEIERIRGMGAGAADALKEQAIAAKGGDAERMRRAASHLHTMQRAENLGLTSVPGYLKSLVKKPGETISTGFKSQWQNLKPWEKAVTVGLPAVSAVNTAFNKNDEHKGENIGRQLGSVAFNAAPIPFAGLQALTSGAQSLTGRLGRMADQT